MKEGRNRLCPSRPLLLYFEQENLRTCRFLRPNSGFVKNGGRWGTGLGNGSRRHGVRPCAGTGSMAQDTAGMPRPPVRPSFGSFQQFLYAVGIAFLLGSDRWRRRLGRRRALLAGSLRKHRLSLEISRSLMSVRKCTSRYFLQTLLNRLDDADFS